MCEARRATPPGGPWRRRGMDTTLWESSLSRLMGIGTHTIINAGLQTRLRAKGLWVLVHTKKPGVIFTLLWIFHIPPYWCTAHTTSGMSFSGEPIHCCATLCVCTQTKNGSCSGFERSDLKTKHTPKQACSANASSLTCKQQSDVYSRHVPGRNYIWKRGTRVLPVWIWKKNKNY